MRKTKQEKQIDALIERVYYRDHSGRQIDIMWINPIFKAARAAYTKAAAAGSAPAEIEAAVAASITETIAAFTPLPR
jgi:hypothetical protein